MLAGWDARVYVMPAGEESAAPYGAVKINIKSKNALAVGGLALSLPFLLTNPIPLSSSCLPLTFFIPYDF